MSLKNVARPPESGDPAPVLAYRVHYLLTRLMRLHRPPGSVQHPYLGGGPPGALPYRSIRRGIPGTSPSTCTNNPVSPRFAQLLVQSWSRILWGLPGGLRSYLLSLAGPALPGGAAGRGAPLSTHAKNRNHSSNLFPVQLLCLHLYPLPRPTLRRGGGTTTLP